LAEQGRVQFDSGNIEQGLDFRLQPFLVNLTAHPISWALRTAVRTNPRLTARLLNDAFHLATESVEKTYLEAAQRTLDEKDPQASKPAPPSGDRSPGHCVIANRTHTRGF
jgi:hypothetical protein